MDLILLRHGNTFREGETPRWIGMKEDLPLAPSGVDQAHAVAQLFQRSKALPEAIYAAPLRRTRSYAALIADQLKSTNAPIIDDRLAELDYGKWGGLSKEEIIGSFGEEELSAWDQKGVWPLHAGWPQSEDEIRGEVRQFLAEIATKHRGDNLVAAVSSGGRLRYFLDSIPGERNAWKQSGTFKMGTGALTKLTFEGKLWRLVYWNQKPEILPNV